MAQHTRCFSDSFAGKDVVDTFSHRFGPDRSHPTKRVRRLLHDPTRVQPMERVFSEYDWRTDKFASTLRVVSDPSCSSFPPRRSKSAISQFRNTMESPRPEEIIPVLNPSISRVNPSALQRVPDAARLSSYLLTSEDMQGTADMGNGGPLPFYPTSPISRDESSPSSHWSPLQQFIASCETPEDEYASSRIPKRRRDGAPTRETPRGLIRRQGFGVGNVDSSVNSDRTIVTGRSRANTWDSDVTALDTIDDVSSSGEKGKSVLVLSPSLDLHNPIASVQLPCAPSTDFIGGRIDVKSNLDTEDDAEISDATWSATHHALLNAPDLWTVWEGEERTPTSSSAGPNRTKRKPRTAFSPNPNPSTQNRNLEIEEIQVDTGFDAASSNIIEDDHEIPTTDSIQKRNPIATFASAVRLRYVSLCLRIQLDAFRVEKKVKRKLRDPWMKSPLDERVLDPGRA